MSLFKEATSHIPGIAVTSLPVKKAMIALPDPNHTAKSNWTDSCVVIGHLVAALHGMAEFWSGDHGLLMRDFMDEIFRRHAKDAERTLGKA